MNFRGHVLRPAPLAVWLVACLLLTGPSSAVRATGGDVAGVERVEVQPTESTRLSAGLHGEFGRRLTPHLEYDSLRLAPLSVQYGLTPRFELGANLEAASNDGDFDESGVEFLELSGKYRWNRFLAVRLSLGRSFDDGVLPHGGEGTRLELNVPAQYPFGPGIVLAQLGYVSNSGDFGPVAVWDDYARYGIGYAYEMTRRLELVMEAAGHGPTVDIDGTSLKKHLDLNFLAHFKPNRSSTVTPRLGVGLAEGSPDVAVGLSYSVEFGLPQPIRRPYRESTPMPVPSDTDAEQPLMLRSDTGGGPVGDSPAVSPSPGRGVASTRRARRAYESGNLEEAIELYERALRRDPGSVEILSNLGSLHFRRGNYRRARDRYRQALDYDPDDYFSHLYLGITYERLGAPDRARTHYRRARDLRPDADEPRRRLRGLPPKNTTGSDTRARP